MYYYCLTIIIKMVKIKSKLIKVGNSYGVLIPKAFIKTGMINENQEYEIEIKDTETLELEEEVKLLKQKLQNRDLIPSNAKDGISYIEALTSVPTIADLC